MPLTKEALIEFIYRAFDKVELGNGVGLWEGQGLDDYLGDEECNKLREKDETKDWTKISLTYLLQCSSSLSFFDAEGMRFHLPKLLLYGLDYFQEEEELLFQQKVPHIANPPEIEWKLKSVVSHIHNNEQGNSMFEYFQKQFSLLNTAQTQCVVQFLEFQLNDYTKQRLLVLESYGANAAALEADRYVIETREAISLYWQPKLETLIAKEN